MKFYQKLRDILKAINEENFNFSEFIKNETDLRHFLHNLDSWERLPSIDTVIQSILSDKIKWNLQIELIWYFEKIVQSHTDKILEYLVTNLEWCEPWVYRRVAFLIEKMNPQNWWDKLYQLAFILLQSDDYIVREFTMRNAWSKLIGHYETKQILDLSNYVLDIVSKKKEPGSQDETVDNKWWKLAFKRRTKDLYDANFREAVSFVGQVAKQEDSAVDWLGLLIKKYDEVLETEVKEKRKKSWPIQYLSTRWLPSSFGKDEYHENNPTERFALEIWSVLEYRKKESSTVFQALVKILLETHYVVYFEILVRLLDTDTISNLHGEIQKYIIYNDALWQAWEVWDKRRFNLFQQYFILFPEDIATFSKKLKEHDDKISKAWKPSRYITILATSIPKDKRDKSIIDKRNEYMKNEWMDPKEPTPHEDSNIWPIERIVLTTWEILNMSVKELTSTLIEYSCSDNFEKSIWDLYEPFKEYFKTYPSSWEEFYSWLPDPSSIEWIQQLDGYLETIGRATEWLLDTVDKTNKEWLLQYLMDIDDDLHDRDRWSRRKIVAILNSEAWIRSEEFREIKDKNFGLYDDIVTVLTEYIEFPETNNDTQDDTYALVNYANNTVVGWAIELLTAILYFGANESIKNTLKTIVAEGDVIKQSVIIRNLVYNITKDYDFCKEIINSIGNPDQPCIQYAFIEYMFKLGKEKINSHFSTIDHILEHSNKDISILLSDLLLQLLINWINGPEAQPIESIINKLIENPQKYISWLERFARWLGTNMDFVFTQEDVIQQKALHYYDAICTIPKSTEDNEDYNKAIHHIKVSLSYFLDKRPTSKFDIIKNASIFEMLFTSNAADAYQNINEYLLKCIKDSKHIQECINILAKEIESIGDGIIPFLTQYPYDSEIADIIENIKELQKTSAGTIDQLQIDFIDGLFDKWLELWWEKFYKLFYKYYDQESPTK